MMPGGLMGTAGLSLMCFLLAVEARIKGLTVRAQTQLMDTLCVLALGEHAPTDDAGQVDCDAALGKLQAAASSGGEDLAAGVDAGITVRAAEVEAQWKTHWFERLGEAVNAATAGTNRLHAVAGPVGAASLRLSGEDLHHLYTVLVDPDFEQEGCFAGCAQLPAGWCRTCDFLCGKRGTDAGG